MEGDYQSKLDNKGYRCSEHSVIRSVANVIPRESLLNITLEDFKSLDIVNEILTIFCIVERFRRDTQIVPLPLVFPTTRLVAIILHDYHVIQQTCYEDTTNSLELFLSTTGVYLLLFKDRYDPEYTSKLICQPKGRDIFESLFRFKDGPTSSCNCHTHKYSGDDISKEPTLVHLEIEFELKPCQEIVTSPLRRSRRSVVKKSSGGGQEVATSTKEDIPPDSQLREKISERNGINWPEPKKCPVCDSNVLRGRRIHSDPPRILAVTHGVPVIVTFARSAKKRPHIDVVQTTKNSIPWTVAVDEQHHYSLVSATLKLDKVDHFVNLVTNPYLTQREYFLQDDAQPQETTLGPYVQITDEFFTTKNLPEVLFYILTSSSVAAGGKAAVTATTEAAAAASSSSSSPSPASSSSSILKTASESIMTTATGVQSAATKSSSSSSSSSLSSSAASPPAPFSSPSSAPKAAAVIAATEAAAAATFRINNANPVGTISLKCTGSESTRSYELTLTTARANILTADLYQVDYTGAGGEPIPLWGITLTYVRERAVGVGVVTLDFKPSGGWEDSPDMVSFRVACLGSQRFVASLQNSGTFVTRFTVKPGQIDDYTPAQKALKDCGLNGTSFSVTKQCQGPEEFTMTFGKSKKEMTMTFAQPRISIAELSDLFRGESVTSKTCPYLCEIIHEQESKERERKEVGVNI